ncbi:hypothetical protein H310_01013 [Aphanomyces invadans]|uniref:EF-hand domain-containing protein n=1 Tax=Aphanomyces invadans TaxID=157072 RepID=A0A024UPV2_9STRA|nr:hypothetical protein H310_01013 [Aphanomyces invadans]ETW08431.1 hypothetical protein H310_01013 [Aphanomyces invadans]|eukprot:XP_008862236.1 hypothetical protein H310_01013 [Aphanomyces invadans]
MPCSSTPPAQLVQQPSENDAALRAFRVLLSADPSKCLRSAFLTWDTDRDGVVSEQECRDMFTSMGWATSLGPTATDQVLQCVLDPTTRAVALTDFCRLSCETEPAPMQVTEGNLQASSTLPRSTIKSVISTLRSRYDKESLGKIFRAWDDAKAGHLTPAMLERNLRKLHMSVHPQVIQDLVHTYDVDKDGAMDFAEFNAFVTGPQVDDHDRSVVVERNRTLKSHVKISTTQPSHPTIAVRKAAEVREAMEEGAVQVAERVFQKLKPYKTRIADVFKEMDEDESGVLSYAEFRQGLKHKGIHLTDQEFHHLMTDVDRDKNGLVSFQELAAHLNSCEKMVQNHLCRMPLLTSWAEDESVPKRKTSFNFDQLRRKVRAPTRRGRTPAFDTRFLIIGPSCKLNACQADASERFHVESNQFGPSPTTSSIGGSDKAARAMVHAMRQRRIAELRHSQDVYTATERLKCQQLEDNKSTYSPPERTRYFLKLQQRADRDATAWDLPVSK